ncbi:WXG100 family type VII secretion target [Nonomuraea insulae]|uniref:WXG100 family type VII secretion target n=1 Tax=Nonomuraea insulae TaxID=1616787 RepID=A0ABW1CP71_9ACTN
MADHWEPIRVYEVPTTSPGADTTRQQILAWLNATDPDSVSSAGESYVYAADLIRGKDGIQSAIMRVAKDLASVWRGDSATTALKALRLLHASAGALADAMHDTGKPMTEYAGEVKSTREKIAGATGGLPLLNRYNNGGNFGGDGTLQSPYTPPLLTDSGSGNSLTSTIEANLRARLDMEELNTKIDLLNRRLAEGLSFQMPDISPIEVELTKQDKLDPGSGSDTPTGKTTYWNGSGSDDGTTGSSSTGSDSDTTTPETTKPQDTTPTDPEQGQDDPDTDPQDDPATPEQPGDQDQPADQQDQDQSEQQQQQDVPPVIWADTQTQLADATTNPTTTTQPGTTANTNPYQSTVIPTQTPTATTPNPFTPGPGSNMWYGSGGGSAASAAPAVLRGGAASGSGLMAYPPGMGMGAGAGAGNEGEERTREIYDPEPSVWSVSHDTSPEKIG